MIPKLHRRLTLLYTLTTGLILIAILAVILLTSEQSVRTKDEDEFQRNILELSSKLQYDTSISQSWLRQTEAEDQLIIHIEENAVPFLFEGTNQTNTPRETLVRLAKDAALKEQINTNAAPFSTAYQKSSLLSIKGEHKDSYLAFVFVIPTRTGGFKSLTLLHDLSLVQAQIFWQRILFLAAGVIGICAILIVSWLFVGHSLKPLAENKRKQNEFIASASHELRSPIAVIQAASSAITAEPSRALHFSSTIQKECKRMGHLVNDLLILASAETKGWKISRESVDMDTLLLDVYEKYEPLCLAKNFHLKLSLPDDALPSISGDKERLGQILSILLDNAAAYSAAPDGSVIEIQALALKRVLKIAVIDHGTGVPDSKKKQVFERFYRADSSRKDKSHYGLGLSVALELAHLHDGELLLTDTPGGGCTFTLQLPVS